MKLIAEFFVPGIPVAQQRAKTKYNPVTKQVIGKYDPPQCVEFKGRIANMAFEKIAAAVGVDIPIVAEFTVFLPRPASVTRKKYPRPVKKPDWDNLGKGPSDALEAIAYCRDSQIVDCRVRKFYADDECRVGTEIRLWIWETSDAKDKDCVG